MTRRVVAVTVAVLLTAAPAVMGGATAQATQYRYWTYWHGTHGAWQFSGVGPAAAVPADGEVEGWRFAVTEGVRGQGQAPRIAVAAAFRQFCGTRTAAAGQKRVAVVFDFGEAADAPDGQSPPAARGTCAVLPAGANGAAVLSQAATLRTDRGLVCAIAGYPQGECAPALSPSTSPEPRRSPSPPEPDGTAGQGGAAPGSDRSAAPATRPRTDAAAPPPDDRAESPGDPVTHARPDDQVSRKSQQAAERPRTGRTSASAAATPDAAPATAASAAPVFVEADAAVTAPPGQSWLPIAAVAALIAGIGGFVWWRRRA